MARSLGLTGAFLAFFCCVWAGPARAQSPGRGSWPAAGAPELANNLSPPPVAQTQGLIGEPNRLKRPPLTPGVGPYGISAYTSDPLLTPESYRLERPGTTAGWFADLDLGLVKPHVTNRIDSGAAVSPAFTTPVVVPVAPLNWTVSPRFELGYRLPDGRGDLRLGYRFLATTRIEAGPAAEFLKSRLDYNVIDLDYVSGEWLAENWFGPFRDLRLVFGVRLATSYLDSVSRGGAALDESFSSHYVGAGPHFGLGWSRSLPRYPLELYTRFDAAWLVGRTQQGFTQAGSVRRDGGQSNGVEMVHAEVGLGWRPDPTGRGRVVAGYQFEQWWDLGRTDTSNFELTVQGVFLRAEWRY